MGLNQEIKKWSKENKWFLIILGIGIFLRLYYLILTANQALWWDEAEYLLMSQYFATGNQLADLLASRPLLLPLIFAFFIKIGLGYEIIYRIFEFLVSIAGLVFLYLTAKRLFNKEIGVIATLLLSVFYLHLFYTSRILLDSLSPTFWIISIYFFSTGYLLNKNNKYFYLSAFFGALGVFFYNQTIALFIIYLIFLLIIEKSNLFKEKRFYLFALVAILTFLPNLIINKILYGNFTEFIRIGIITGNIANANFLENIIIYLRHFTTYLRTLLLVLFIISLVVVFYKLIIGIDLIFKKPDLEIKKQLFLLLWLVLSFLIIIKIVGHFEDRYIMPTFLPIFIITAIGLWQLKEYFLNPTNKRRLYAILIVLLVIVSFTQVVQADKIIKLKIGSFNEFREGGNWIEKNSDSNDLILAVNSPLLIYHSQRRITPLPKTEEEILPLIENEKPKYLVIHAFEKHPDYIQNLLKYEIFTPVQVYQSGNNIIFAVFAIAYNQ